jgi:hypothetical protein
MLEINKKNTDKKDIEKVLRQKIEDWEDYKKEEYNNNFATSIFNTKLKF